MVVALALAIVAFIALLGDALSDEFIIGDFAQDYISAEAARAGEDPYAPLPTFRPRHLDVEGELFPGIHVNPHPPARIALFTPLTAMPYRTARVVWFVIGAGFLISAGWLLGRTLGLSKQVSVALGAAFLILPAAQLDLRLGHIEALLLLLVVVTWLGMRRGAQVASGVGLGVAAAIALYPAFLVIPLLRLRQIRAVVSAAAAFAAANLLAALLLGFGSLVRFVTEASPQNTDRWTPDPQNVSLAGIPLRWLRDTFWRPEAPDLPALAYSLALLIMAGCAVAAYRTRHRLSGDPFLAALPWMLLASPLTWDHYLLISVPAIVAIVARHGRDLLAQPWVTAAIALVVIARLPGLTAVHPTTLIEAALWWALPGYALLALAVFDFHRGKNDIRWSHMGPAEAAPS